MKKRIVYGLASAMVFSSIGTPVMAAYAQTQPVMDTTTDTVTIKDPQDFIDLYCSLKEEKKDNGGIITVQYKLYTVVDRTNYEQILKGKPVYDSLDKEFRQKIDDTLKSFKLENETTLNKTYDMFVQEALSIQEEVLKEKEEASTTEESQSQEDSTQTKEEDHTSSDEKKEVETSSQTKDEAVEETEKTTPSDVEDEKTEKESETISEETVVENTESVQLYSPVNLLMDSKASGTELSEKMVPETVSLLQTEPQTVSNIVEEQAALQTEIVQPKKASQEVTLSSISQEVQNFIRNYLMDDNGNLYTSVTPSNYKQILAGVSTYTGLSTDKVSQLNSYLLANGSRQYFSLVSQAQQIENGGVTYNQKGIVDKKGIVDTSTSSGFGLYGALLGMSVAAFGALLKKFKKTNG